LWGWGGGARANSNRPAPWVYPWGGAPFKGFASSSPIIGA
jgi:hypothetical protein